MIRIERLLDKLHGFYGALLSPPSDPFTLFVWEVLSIHTAPRKRDAVFAALKKLRALTPDSMWRARHAALEGAVALAGPYVEQRLHSLREGVEVFRRSPDLLKTLKGGDAASALKAVKLLPRMGEGGAYRMLLFAGSHPVLPVDARLARVARRLGYGSEQANFHQTARSVRHALEQGLPRSVNIYRQAYLYLSHHGAASCTEVSPHCTVCPLRTECPSASPI